MEGYSRIKLVGKGSFGCAYLVHSKKDGTRFIEKEIRVSGLSRAEQEAAKREVKVLRTLEHPNIIRYVDHVEKPDSIHIIMEYADGGDLYSKLKNCAGRRLGEKEIMLFFAQLCLALRHLHDKRILHRDLKTQNVFLTSSGSVKLGDFGISTVLKNTFAVAHTICGTPYYFSPELCQNRAYNNKTDVWSLGCVLYELTTLNHAFDGPNVKVLMQKIIKGVFPPVPPEYSPELSQLIHRMLAREPTQRPSIQSILSIPYVRKYVELLGCRVQQEVEGYRPSVVPSQGIGNTPNTPTRQSNQPPPAQRTPNTAQRAPPSPVPSKQTRPMTPGQKTPSDIVYSDARCRRELFDNLQRGDVKDIGDFRFNLLEKHREAQDFLHKQMKDQRQRIEEISPKVPRPVVPEKNVPTAVAPGAAADQARNAFHEIRRRTEENKKRWEEIVNMREDAARVPSSKDIPKDVIPPSRNSRTPPEVRARAKVEEFAILSDEKKPKISNIREEIRPERRAEINKVLEDISNILASPSRPDNDPADDFEDELDSENGCEMGRFLLDGHTLHLPNVKSEDPLGHRIEVLRVFLEAKMGDHFMEAFRALDGIDDNSTDDVLVQLQNRLGREMTGYLGLVSQLVFCIDEFNRKQK